MSRGVLRWQEEGGYQIDTSAMWRVLKTMRRGLPAYSKSEMLNHESSAASWQAKSAGG
jgi:hypothetical protein